MFRGKIQFKTAAVLVQSLHESRLKGIMGVEVHQNKYPVQDEEYNYHDSLRERLAISNMDRSEKGSAYCFQRHQLHKKGKFILDKNKKNIFFYVWRIILVKLSR